MTTYLVTAATGNIGGRVVERLIARGERPRILVRNAEAARGRFGERVDIAVGDLAEASSLPGALAGVDSVFLLNAGPELAQRDEACAKAAKAAGVKHIVKLSALGARAHRSTSTLGDWHARGEAAVRDSGVAWTFVQPAGFMSNALAWAPAIRAEGVLRSSAGDGKVAMIHPEDVAAVAVEALVGGKYAAESLPITGPQLLTYAEMTRQIGEAVGRSLDFQSISDLEARERLLAQRMPAAVADALVALWRAIREHRVELITDVVERVTGRPAISFAQWVQENAAPFGAMPRPCGCEGKK